LVRAGSIPHKLKLVLSNPRILKVGRAIESDIRTLEQVCSRSTPFQGILDIARYAQERHVITSAQSLGLSDLCARVLGKSLRKNTPERIGEGWERETLSEAQIEYAASDAFVSLALYNTLSNIPKPIPIQPHTPLPAPGTPVLLFNNGRTVIAHAIILDQPGNKVFDDLNLDDNHVVIEVTEVVVPGALVHSHRRRALKVFGATPFTLVALLRNLRIYHPLPSFPALPARLSTLAQEPSHSPSSSTSVPHAAVIEPQDNRSPGLPEAIVPSDSGVTMAQLAFDVPDSLTALLPNRDDVDVDADAQQEGLEILGPAQTKWKTEITSRVLKDPFHIFNMFYISAAHGLRVDFAQALRDAMFIPDPEDAERIKVWGRSQVPPVTFEEVQGAMALGSV
jgi:3'-5' exonuclease